jgi:penicillin G amidase
MKVFKYIMLGFSGLCVLIVVSALIYLNYLKKGSLPDYNAKVLLPEIEQEVTVYRDSFAIPHVYAKSENDLYRTVGFVMAQDRLWQMDLLRRVTIGRLSEIFGDDLVDTDLLMRSLRITTKSEKILQEADPKILEALYSFSAGVNHYMQKYPLPPEFKILGYHPEPWEPFHSVNLIGYMAWDLTHPWDNEVLLYKITNMVGEEQAAEIIPDLFKQKTTVISDYGYGLSQYSLISAGEKLKEIGAVVFQGSNNWAVAGEKSVTGMPLLANDMHLGINIPGIWYQMHQFIEGELNVTGVVLPGQPWIISGHNDSIAWGMTNVMVDDMDFYIETLNADTTMYLLDGEWRNLEIRNESIKVKGGNIIEKTLRFTHRGPVISHFKNLDDHFVSMRWIGNEPSDEISTVYKLNRANNWEDFRNAVKTFIAVSQNVVYADKKGNIALQTCAGIPIRKGDIYGFYPGNTSKYDWTGLVPFEELPFEFNPARGFVSSANNKTVPENYPYKVSYWFALPNRINRIREMLVEKEKLSLQDFQQMQNDVTSKLAQKLLGLFLPMLEEHQEWTNNEQEALDKLKKWDCNLSLKSSEAPVFEVLYRKVIENLVRDDLDEELFALLMGNKIMSENLLLNVIENTQSKWPDNGHTQKVESFKDILIISFRESIDELKFLVGDDLTLWNWERLNSLTLKHPLGSIEMLNKVFKLNRGPYPVPGSFHTVCPYTYPFIKPFEVDNGASQRHVYDLSNWDASKTVIPTGTSGIPSSPYYCDQSGLYISGRYHSDYFSLHSVIAAHKYKMVVTGK